MSDVKFSHVSVLLNECIEALNIRDGYTYIDCTAGGGGHSLEIAKRLGNHSRLICFDRDKNAIEAAKKRLSAVPTSLPASPQTPIKWLLPVLSLRAKRFG